MNDQRIDTVNMVLMAGGSTPNMNIQIAVDIFASAHNCGETDLKMYLLLEFRKYFDLYYDIIEGRHSDSRLGLLSSLAAIFVNEPGYEGEYNKVCYLIKKDMQVVRRQHPPEPAPMRFADDM